MTSKSQQAAVRRYEASGKRPGARITVRLSDEQHDRLVSQRQPGEPLSATLKRLANLDSTGESK